MANDIFVCPLARLEDTVAETGARFVVTAINPWSIPETPAGVADANHLRLTLNDIEAPHGDLIHPRADHIADLVAFAERWNRNGPMVVHCLAGISRSSASAFIVACHLNPQTAEQTIANAMRQASLTARPNALMVRLADRFMARDGRMIAAIESLAPAGATLQATPFAIPSCF